MNTAFMAKLGWRMMKEKEALWVKVLVNKYIGGDNYIDNIKHNSGASNA